MRLGAQNWQKMQVKRASLWAGVYHSAVMQNATMGQSTLVPTAQADLALKEFDDRFKVEYGKGQKPEPVKT